MVGRLDTLETRAMRLWARVGPVGASVGTGRRRRSPLLGGIVLVSFVGYFLVSLWHVLMSDYVAIPLLLILMFIVVPWTLVMAIRETKRRRARGENAWIIYRRLRAERQARDRARAAKAEPPPR
jgi:hypothetical protein